MNRKEKTKFLSELLEREKLYQRGHYWANEVCLDYGTKNVTRVDYLEFTPQGQIDISDIEKGYFTCWEIKSCKDDFNSGFGRNFFAEKNYFVMDMETYKEVVHEISHSVGVYVPIPKGMDKYTFFENPKPLSSHINEWELVNVKPAHAIGRNRPMNELLFCMLRAGH